MSNNEMKIPECVICYDRIVSEPPLYRYYNECTNVTGCRAVVCDTCTQRMRTRYINTTDNRMYWVIRCPYCRDDVAVEVIPIGSADNPVVLDSDDDSDATLTDDYLRRNPGYDNGHHDGYSDVDLDADDESSDDDDSWESDPDAIFRRNGVRTGHWFSTRTSDVQTTRDNVQVRVREVTTREVIMREVFEVMETD